MSRSRHNSIRIEPEYQTVTLEAEEFPRPIFETSNLAEVPMPEQILRRQLRSVHEITARWVAFALVLGFIILLILPFMFLFSTPKPTPEIKAEVVSETVDLIKTVSAVLSGLLGAVVGYYFRVETEK